MSKPYQWKVGARVRIRGDLSGQEWTVTGRHGDGRLVFISRPCPWLHAASPRRRTVDWSVLVEVAAAREGVSR